MWRGALLMVVLLGAAACQTSRTRPSPPLGYAPLIPVLTSTDAEQRYHAARALARHDSRVVRARLRTLLEDEDPMIRNAAARSLADLGEEEAAAALIANLHRDQRTFVTTDAIHQLRALFGTDLGYDPNRGYRHQTETLEAWWRWWERRGHARPATPTPEDPHADRREALGARLDVLAETSFESEAEAWAAGKALWAALGEIAPSRNPDDVDVVARGFGGLAHRFPDQVDLWNNYALATLNAGDAATALAAYDVALSLAPDDPQLANDRGIALEALGRLDEALAAYERAAALAPDDDVARSNAGDVLAKLGRRTEAASAYRDAERLAPEKWMVHRLWLERLSARSTASRRSSD